jgi:UDP-N-acetylmuramate--alanine ligase
VTNVSLDHKPLPELRSLFGDFIARADTAIINHDNQETRQLSAHAKRSLTFSLSDDAADIFASAITPGQSYVDFHLHHKGSASPHHCRIQQPGRHNVANALAAIAAAQASGLKLGQACEAIGGFSGIKRRFEIVGTRNNITVIDDFGHNPDKIAATLETLHEFPGRLIIMFQPHGYGPLNLMRKELVDCFATQLSNEDKLLMPDPAYYGGTTNRIVGSQDIVSDVQRRGRSATYCEHRADCLPLITSTAKPGDRIVVMGARDDTLSEFALQILNALS